MATTFFKKKPAYEAPFVAPCYPGIQAKNHYGCSKDEIENGMPQPNRQGEGTIMMGPKYPGIEESHKYNPPSRRDELPTVDIVTVPVYIEDGANKYCNVPEKQYGELFHPLPLHGPNVESKNCYNPEEEKQPGQLVMAGPKFVGIDDQCKYTPAIKKADTEGMIVVAGPCFRQIVHTSLYNETPARAPIEGTPLMTTPIYPGIKAENNFGPAHMGF